MLVSCDISAARKVCGFLGHAAKLGCSKCLKSFETGGHKFHEQYAGFEDAPLRTETSHHPMHNLFLGTAKHMMKHIWLADSDGRNALLTTRDLEIIQNRVDLCVVPSFFGRIPRKIASKFCNFKADQWKSWILVFSVYALYNILGSVHLKCWRKFVHACRILLLTILTIEKVSEAHCLLIKFCKDVESLYGKEATTMNMHLHTHLKECILDCGPLSSFLMFAFERFNDYLGKFPTNNRCVEIQIMRKFCRDMHFRNLPISNSIIWLYFKYSNWYIKRNEYFSQ
uniref:Uncharacterized protein n=1 Tax=Amphimedon queenslandica TaxID=400682 RepID=A0A1X7TFZ4_AMPQE